MSRDAAASNQLGLCRSICRQGFLSDSRLTSAHELERLGWIWKWKAQEISVVTEFSRIVERAGMRMALEHPPGVRDAGIQRDFLDRGRLTHMNP